MSWKPEVQTVGDGDSWTGNMLRFETLDEAIDYAKDLKARWMLVTNIRAVESSDPPTDRWTLGGLKPYNTLAQSMLLDDQKGSP